MNFSSSATEPQRKRIALLGATGSIGQSTLRVIEKHSDRLELVAVSAHSGAQNLAEIVARFGCKHAALTDSNAYACAKKDFPKNCALVENLTTLATLPEIDCVVVATVGTAGLVPTLAAIEAGKTVALANKEVLVMAGGIVMKAVQKANKANFKNESSYNPLHSCILPIDSEHSAILQCLQGNPKRGISKILITASGGAFRDFTLEQMQNVTPAQALQHPNWNMGAKVTLDCATLANKGLELIEAHHLFNVPAHQLGALMHRQSIIHSIVQFLDGCWMAQMSPPNMVFPIQYALLYPDRAPCVEPSIDLNKAFTLDLAPVDFERFPALKLALESLEKGGTAPAVYNAANEIAAYAFLKKEIAFLSIPTIIEKTLDAIPTTLADSLESVFAADQEARKIAQSFLSN